MHEVWQRLSSLVSLAVPWLDIDEFGNQREKSNQGSSKSHVGNLELLASLYGILSSSSS